MSYEPTGKVKPFIDALRREPARIWRRIEVSDLTGIPTSNLTPFLNPAMHAQVVFREIRNNEIVFRGTPFDPVEKPTPDTWTPPQMIPPRPGSDRTPSSFTAGEQVEVPVFVQPQPEPQVASPPPALTVSPQPAAAPSVEPVAEGGESGGDEPAPFGFCRWDDGDIDIFGLIELENGAHRITAEQWDRLKREFAWTRPA